VRRALAAALLVVAALSAASASAGPAVTKRPQWRLTITGVQTLHWEMTSSFPGRGPEPCDIRHSGDQTIRFGTGRAFPARLYPINDVIFASVLRAHVVVGGKYRGVVPLTGSEHRSYHVIQKPANASSCDASAAPYLQDCSGTRPLAQGTGTLVDTRPPKARVQKVAMRVPVGTALQSKFPECRVLTFDLRNDWVYPLFTYGDWRTLVGGSPLSSSTRRLTAHGSTSACFEDGYPQRIDGTRCGNPHVARITIDWRVVLSR
jgi:hypothetical protein